MGTKLNIVNAMLSAVGEGEQNTLATLHPSVLKAVNFIDGNNEQFQNRGWWFNKDYNLKLLPNTEGFIQVPANCLAFAITGNSLATSSQEAKERYVVRGNRVYDTKENTYVMPGYVVADITTMLPVELLPSAAFTYLKKMCIAEFYLDDDGDLGKADRLDQKAKEAWLQLKTEELRSTGVNVNDRPAVQALTYRQGGYSINPRWPGGRY